MLIRSLIALAAGVVAQESVFSQTLTTEIIVERSAPATITIAVMTTEGGRQGSGFLIDESGTIVTNNHVIQNARSGKVTLNDGSTYPGFEILSTDEPHDLAIIRIPGSGLPHLTLGDSDSVRVGQDVTVIGAPYGLEATVSTGIISALRQLEGLRLFQLTAPISSGSSGGPIISRAGQVIGVATSQLAEGQNLNFAVPINYVHDLLQFQKSDQLIPVAPLLHAPGLTLRYGVTPTKPLSYVRTQIDHVTQTVDGKVEDAVVRSYWQFQARIMADDDGGRLVSVIHDSISIETPPTSTHYPALYGEPIEISMDARGLVTDIRVPINLIDSSPRLDLESTYRAFFPVLPDDPIDSTSGTWSDTIHYDTTQSGMRMNIQRINKYISQGQALYEGREALRVEYTTEVLIEGEGTQHGSIISLSGMGTGRGSFYFLPDPGLFLGGEEASDISMQAFVVTNDQSDIIPIEQSRREIIEMSD